MEETTSITDLMKKKFKNLFNKDKKSQETETAKDISSYSMNEGDTGTIFGLNRDLLRWLAVGVGTLFIAALMYNSSDEPQTTKKETQIAKGNSNPMETEANMLDGLPGTYQDVNDLKKKNTAANTQKPPAAEPKKETKKEQPTPKIPANYTQLPRVSVPVAAPVEQKQEKKKDDPFTTTIAFWGGDSDNSSLKSGNNAQAATGQNGEAGQKISPQYVAPNNSTIITGTIIPVRLLTGINTDVPGQVMAQVLSDVYDSSTGTNVLIPQGSKITGTYDIQAVANGRVPLVFQQINFPNGGSWTLGNSLVAVDGPGYAGAKGKVNHHTGQKISAGLFGSAIAAMGSIAAGNTNSGNNNNYTAGQLATQGAMANLINVTSEMFKKASDVTDTVTIEPGYEFNLYVTENINFEG